MTSFTRTVAFSALALGALVAAAPVVAGAGAQQRPEPRWALSWDAAMQEAKERNVPIYIAFHQDR